MLKSPHCVLVIGYGFVGSHLVEHLRARGKAPVVLTKEALPEPTLARLSGVRTLVADAADTRALTDALEGVDHVMFSVAGLMPAEANADPLLDLQLAVGPLLVLLDALRQRPGVGLTYFSSGGTVYGRARSLPIREDHPTDPLGAYGITKLAAEKYIRMARERDGLHARVLRCSNVYGPGQPSDRSQGVVAAFVHRLLHGQPVRIFGAGTEVRDYVFIDDVVRAATDLLDAPDAPSLLNVGAGEGISVIDLLGVLQELVGVRAEVETTPPRGFDVPEIVLDITRLRQAIAFAPTPLRIGLAKTIDAARKAAS